MSSTNRADEAARQRRQQSRPTQPDMRLDRQPESTSSNQSVPSSDARLIELHHLYQVIADVGAALKITPERLAEGEALERLEVVARIPVEQFARCDATHAAGWFAALVDDLSLDLRLDGQDPDMPPVVASLRAGSDPAGGLRTFQRAAQSAAETQGDAVSVEARLSVGKTRALVLAHDLLAQRSGIAAPAMVAVFYTAAAWNQLINLAAVPYLEQSGLVRADGRACVVLCDSQGYLAGAALECVGAAHPTAPDWLAVSPAALRQFIAREEASRRLLAEEAGWPDAPHVITVEMLHLVARAPGLEATAARLAILRTELAATVLATIVQGRLADGLTLRYSGARPATCHLSATDEHAISSAVGEREETLARLAEWATRRGTVDTLIIARECLARELSPGHTVTLAEVAQAAVGALEAAKANFTLFVRGQTDRYFAARQTAQDAVADYAATVRRAVSDLTSDVVDNVYRTVGLLAAVVIAGLIQPASSPLFVLLAAILYSAYIAFVIFFLLRAREDRFTLEEAALTARLSEMAELTTAEHQRLRAPATSADAHYRHYMGRTRLIYYVLLALGIVVALIFLVITIIALVNR